MIRDINKMSLEKLKLAFSHSSGSQAAKKQALEAIKRKLVSSLAKGNGSLQRGRYQTKQDLENRYQKVASHKFC